MLSFRYEDTSISFLFSLILVEALHKNTNNFSLDLISHRIGTHKLVQTMENCDEESVELKLPFQATPTDNISSSHHLRYSESRNSTSKSIRIYLNYLKTERNTTTGIILIVMLSVVCIVTATGTVSYVVSSHHIIRPGNEKTCYYLIAEETPVKPGLGKLPSEPSALERSN